MSGTQPLNIPIEVLRLQRELFFRPWMTDTRTVVLGSASGATHAATYGKSGIGVISDETARREAEERHPQTEFTSDLPNLENVDFFFAAEGPELLPEGIHLPAKAVIGGYRCQFKNSAAFKEWATQVANGREITYLSQGPVWPGTPLRGLINSADCWLAVIGEDLPDWPSLGLVMPTVNSVNTAISTASSLIQSYPGQLHLVTVANGSSETALDELLALTRSMPNSVSLITRAEQMSFASATNLGLKRLSESEPCDLYGVVHDDVLSSNTCLTELVSAWQALILDGQTPGTIAPITNDTANIGAFSDLATMAAQAELWHHARHSNVTLVEAACAPFVLITREALEAIGGYDPRFSPAGFEDLDYALRLRHAGFTSWIVDGAFAYHHGGQTLGEGTAKDVHMERTRQIFCWKWDLIRFEDWTSLSITELSAPLRIPLDAAHPHEFTVNIEGVSLDLVSQASDMEFAKWVYDRMQVRHRETRRRLIKMLLADVPSHAVIGVQVESEVTAA